VFAGLLAGIILFGMGNDNDNRWLINLGGVGVLLFPVILATLAGFGIGRKPLIVSGVVLALWAILGVAAVPSVEEWEQQLADRKAKELRAEQERAEQKQRKRELAEQKRKEAERREQLAAKRRREKEAACRKDLQCLGDKHASAAGIKCDDQVERLAKYDVKWTDGWTEPKFSHFRWKDKEKGIITYIGDKAQFQNGFGAWQNVIYECDLDTRTNSPLEVRAQPGRL